MLHLKYDEMVDWIKEQNERSFSYEGWVSVREVMDQFNISAEQTLDMIQDREDLMEVVGAKTPHGIMAYVSELDYKIEYLEDE